MAGQPYILTFYAAQRSGYPSQSFSVSLGGTTLGTITPTSTSYQLYNLPIIGPGTGNYTLKFTGLNPNNTDETAFVDDVSIVSSPTLFQDNSATSGGDDYAFVVPDTSDNDYTTSQNGPTGINYFTSGQGSLRSAVSYCQNWMDSNPYGASMAILLTATSTNYLLDINGEYDKIEYFPGEYDDIPIAGEPITTSVEAGDSLSVIGSGWRIGHPGMVCTNARRRKRRIGRAAESGNHGRIHVWRRSRHYADERYHDAQ